VVGIVFVALLLSSASASAGHWEPDTLANDEAADFVTRVVSRSDVGSIRGTLLAALAAASPIEDDQASRALAAAELVAVMSGKPSSRLPVPCREWAGLHSEDADKDLVQSATQVVEKIATASETKELMREGGATVSERWQASVNDLKGRLAKP
jgi:hypothetical protein